MQHVRQLHWLNHLSQDTWKMVYCYYFHSITTYRIIFEGNSAYSIYTGSPTTYQTQHLFNNSKTNEDFAMRFEQEYVRCVRNEEECVCSVCLFRCNIFIGFRIIKEMPCLVGSGTPYIFRWQKRVIRIFIGVPEVEICVGNCLIN